MKRLLNDCMRTDIWVNPSNWKRITAKSALKKTWYVQCKFIDPNYAADYPQGFQYRIKINKGNYTLDERRAAATAAIEEMMLLLDVEAYNPITKTFMLPKKVEENRIDYNKLTPLRHALDKAFTLIEVDDHTKLDIKSVLKYFLQFAEQLRYDHIPVNDFLPMHATEILMNIRTKKSKNASLEPLSEKRYNKYVAYLSSLFVLLKKNKMIDENPFEDFQKKKVVVQPRKVLTEFQRKKLFLFLREHYPEYLRFYLIFFHSGGRLKELLELKYEDVNIHDLKYTTVVKKGNSHSLVERPIKKISLKYWESILKIAKKGDYIFSVGLVPGSNKIRRDQVTRRWRIHVKQKLGIDVDQYAGKHLNLTEIVSYADADAAAKAAGHTTSVMVKTTYDVENHQRNMNKVRNVRNHFVDPELESGEKRTTCNSPEFVLIRGGEHIDMAAKAKTPNDKAWRTGLRGYKASIT